MVNARALIRLVVAFVLATGAAAGMVWACGPFISTVQTIAGIQPDDLDAYRRGEIGIVRPHFRRALLAQAYRVMSGAGPIVLASSTLPQRDVYARWQQERSGALAGQATATANQPPRTRRLIDYQTPPNCLEDAYAMALRTLQSRQEQYGNDSSTVRDWVRAQDAVFANCDEEPLKLPEPAPASADALTKADRAYQTAAAYFYSFEFDEAARRFRAIADDASSPWRPYGKYLAARAHLRTVTMGSFTDGAPAALYESAGKEFEAVLADPVAAPLHDSARALLRMTRLRSRPQEELREVSNALTGKAEVPEAVVRDFTWLLDAAVGDTVDFEYATFEDLPGLRSAHDLVDWTLAMQGRGSAADDRAIAKWQETKTIPWLVAALSRLHGPHSAADALLNAAATVTSASPAFASVAYYRVRLLIDLGRLDAARAVLATLPDAPGAGVVPETINLYRAQRLSVAVTFDDLLRAAPRVGPRVLMAYNPTSQPRDAVMVFDDDAGAVFSQRLSLDRLVAASESSILPETLRRRIAVAAFTRAILLDRADQASTVARILRPLAPPLTADLDRYLAESNPVARKRAAILLILRTPGMSRDVRGADDTSSYESIEPRRTFDNFLAVWWCNAGPERSLANMDKGSELMAELYPAKTVPYPSFVGPDERRLVERELATLYSAGSAREYLATQALTWARQRPDDPEVAEALSRVVNGWRRACGISTDRALPQRAFEALHRQFPGSEWAKRTPYWYR